MPLARLRLLPLAATIAAALAAAAPAAAECPGAVPACPYTAIGQVGQRGGGVLRFPQAIAIGPDGTVYVGDEGSHTVQAFAADGTFAREVGFAGTRPGELSGIGSLAVGGDGSLLVADGGSDRVDRFDAGGNLLSTFGGRGTEVGRFHFGAGLGNSGAAGGGLAASGNTLFVADTANDRVLRFTLDGQRGTEIVPPGTLANPRGLAVRGTRLIVADDQHHRLAVFDTGGHLLHTVGTGPGPMPGQLNFPYDVTIDPSGRVFVADDLNHRVVRYGAAPAYPYKARWGSYGTKPGQLAYPRGIATDAAGNVYVTNTGDDRVDVFDRSGRLLRSFGASGRAAGQFNMPLGVGIDASGLRAVADGVNGRIELLNSDGSIVSVWGSPAPGPTILPHPVAVVFDSGGNAYVLDQRRARIVVFARATGLPDHTIGSLGSGPGQLLSPSAMAIDASGGLWVADSGNQRIAHFTPQGDYLGSIVHDGAVRGIAVSADGSRIYTTDNRNRITVNDPSGELITEFGGTGTKLGKLAAPAQIALDAAGNLWVADRANNRIQEFGPNGERLGAFGQRGVGPGQFVHPTGVSIDCHGLLTVTDTDNNRVQQFALATPAVPPCAAMPAVGNPPPPKLPTLPAPPGPQVSLRVLRTTGLFTVRTLPLDVGCDTTCSVTADAILVQRGTPRHGHRRATARLRARKVTIRAGQTKIIRLALSRANAKRLRHALHGRRGLEATIELTAVDTAGGGLSTSVGKRVIARG